MILSCVHCISHRVDRSRLSVRRTFLFLAFLSLSREENFVFKRWFFLEPGHSHGPVQLEKFSFSGSQISGKLLCGMYLRRCANTPIRQYATLPSGDLAGILLLRVKPERKTPIASRTNVQNNQESRCKYWATRLTVCSFACTTFLFTCSLTHSFLSHGMAE